MPGYGVVPGPAELGNMLDKGMTRQEIADEVFRRTGHTVTLNAISMAIKRGGLGRERRRYDDLIPWRVRQEHDGHYAQACLRLEARRRRGEPLTASDKKRLSSWLRKLDAGKVVVHYQPDSPDGFYLVPREPSDTDIIRRPKE